MVPPRSRMLPWNWCDRVVLDPGSYFVVSGTWPPPCISQCAPCCSKVCQHGSVALALQRSYPVASQTFCHLPVDNSVVSMAGDKCLFEARDEQKRRAKGCRSQDCWSWHSRHCCPVWDLCPLGHVFRRAALILDLGDDHHCTASVFVSSPTNSNYLLVRPSAAYRDEVPESLLLTGHCTSISLPGLCACVAKSSPAGGAPVARLV